MPDVHPLTDPGAPPDPVAIPNRYWRVAKVARLLDAPEDTVYDGLRRSTIPGLIRVGRLVRVDAAKLTAWLDAGGGALPGGWKRA